MARTFIGNVKGSGIEKIEFTSSTGGDHAGISGATDTYTITFTDGSTSTFEIYNGKDGAAIDDTATSAEKTWSSQQISDTLKLTEDTSIMKIDSLVDETNFGLGSANHFYVVKNGVCYFQIYLLVKNVVDALTIVQQGLPAPLGNEIQYWSFVPYNGAEAKLPLRFAIEANGQAKACQGVVNHQYMCKGSYPVA